MNKSLQLGALAGRALAIEARALDAESRTIEVAFSSEEPVERHFGIEILDHSPGSAHLDRLRAMGPLLLEHDRSQHIGTIESVEIGADRKGRARVRFGTDELAERALSQVRDGIKRAVSVGYRLLSVSEEGERTFRAKAWEPFEISLVSVPADATVGVGRELDSEKTEVLIMETEAKPKETKTAPATGGRSADEHSAYEADLARAAQARGQQAERDRVKHIDLLGEQLAMRELASEYIRNGKSVDAFRKAAQEARGRLDDNLSRYQPGDLDIGLSKREIQEFSFCRAILALADPKNPRAQQAAAFELEASRAAQEKLGRDSDGIMVPNDEVYIPRNNELGRRLAQASQRGEHAAITIPQEVLNEYQQRAALNVGTATAAGNLVGTNLMASSFIELLRNRTLTLNPNALNVRFLRDLRDDISIPRKSGSSGFAWIGTEGANAAEATITVDNVTLSPKTAGAYKDFTRKLLLQSSVDIEQMVREDLADQAAIGMDLAILYGSGASGQPTGIFNTSGIGAVTLATPGAPTHEELVEFESDLETANALGGSLAYVTTPAIRKKLRTTKVDAGSGKFLWSGGMNGMVNDFPGYSTNQVTAGDIGFGNFSDAMAGMWGGVDITVDPYTLSLSGSIRVVLLLSMDVGVRHPLSFSLGA